MKDKLSYKYILIVISCIALVIIGILLDKSRTVHVFDRNNNEIATIVMKDEEIIYNCSDDLYYYVDVVWNEAVAIIMEEQSITNVEASKYIIKNGLDIYSNFDSVLNDTIYSVFSSNKERITDDFAVAISDVNGNLLACYSYSVNEEKNFVINPTYAASAIKPLSVYGPAIDNGTINWSTMINDSPVTKIQTIAGEEDWPRNVEYYTFNDITTAEALQKSYNTIAVKVLKLYGVSNSCDFIENNYGIDVSVEKQMLESLGEDEVLGNIALGYLRNGVTVKDMSGYYQVFANGGTYTTGHSITSIKNNQKNIYEFSYDAKQVLSKETAYICNRMLSLVTKEGGTAEGITINDVDLCVKTGTSDDFNDNWLVGVTPEYVCAVWYSSTRTDYLNDENFNRDIFSGIMNAVKHDINVRFEIPDNIETKEICKKTGLCATERCKEVFQGYYIKNTDIKECDCR